MLRAICLDLMDTMLRDPYREALRAATGMQVAEVHERRDPTAWAEFELALIDEGEFGRRFFRDGPPLDLATFHRVRRAGYRWLPGMRELLDDLDGALSRYVASNYPVWIDEVRRRFALDARCEGVWASYHLGARKPDAAFYARLLERIEAEPRDCLFVDDRERNCEGAEAAGMRAHLFEGADGLRARLAAEGVALPSANRLPASDSRRQTACGSIE